MFSCRFPNKIPLKITSNTHKLCRYFRQQIFHSYKQFSNFIRLQRHVLFWREGWKRMLQLHHSYLPLKNTNVAKSHQGILQRKFLGTDVSGVATVVIAFASYLAVFLPLSLGHCIEWTRVHSKFNCRTKDHLKYRLTSKLKTTRQNTHLQYTNTYIHTYIHTCMYTYI